MTLHFVESGPQDAPALLLGGSLGTTHAMWAPQLATLGERLRVVAFDHRGHGDSPQPPGPYTIAELAEDVLELADALGLERFSYAGVSIGGMVGQWLGARAADRLERLVLICTSPFTDSAAAWAERAQTVRDAGSVEPIADAVAARWVTPEFAAAHPDTFASLRAMLAASPPEGYASCCEAIAAMDLRGELASIAVPTLVVHSREDPSIPFAAGEAIAAAVPGARLVALSPAAHIPSVEKPDEVDALIVEHLA